MRPDAACGHTEYDRGHCGQPDCANYINRCAQCMAWTKGFSEAVPRRWRGEREGGES